MAGTLGLSTPWARQYLPPEMRPAVEAEIPDGHVLGVSAGRRPGSPWRIWLLDSARVEVWRMELYMKDLQGACLFALRRHNTDVVVTADGNGYIRSIEDVA